MTENIGIVWIQHADTTVEDVNEQSAQGVIKVFLEFDWKKELDSQQERGRFKAVSPSFGLGTFGDAHFVHIIPNGNDMAEVLYARKKIIPKSILGIIHYKSSNIDQVLKKNIPFSQIEYIINAYFERSEQRLIGLLNSALERTTN